MHDFQKQFEFGEDGEKVVATTWMDRGWWVAPLYQFVSTKFGAPCMFNGSKRVILPDLMASRNGSTIGIEVKRKTRWCQNQKREWETGCEWRHYKHYMEWSDLTGLPVVLACLHDQEQSAGSKRGLFAIELGKRDPRHWDGKHWKTGKPIHEPMALFRRSDMREIAADPVIRLIQAAKATS